MRARPWTILLGVCPAAVLTAYFVFAGLLSGSVSERTILVYLVLYAVAGLLALVSVVAVWMQRVHIVARILHTLAGISFAIGMLMWFVLPTFAGSSFWLNSERTQKFNETAYSLGILGAVGTVVTGAILLITTIVCYVLATRRFDSPLP